MTCPRCHRCRMVSRGPLPRVSRTRFKGFDLVWIYAWCVVLNRHILDGKLMNHPQNASGNWTNIKASSKAFAGIPLANFWPHSLMIGLSKYGVLLTGNSKRKSENPLKIHPGALSSDG
jgi:hypothetical protein